MIERNLGNVERVIRLMLGLSFGVWALLQPALNGVEWFVILVSLSLMFNGIFSRCYLWYLLDVDTSEKPNTREGDGSSCYIL